MKRCATCRYYRPLSEMDKIERRAFIDFCTYHGIEDFENYGYCIHPDQEKKIVWKNDGKNCSHWEERQEFGVFAPSREQLKGKVI